MKHSFLISAACLIASAPAFAGDAPKGKQADLDFDGKTTLFEEQQAVRQSSRDKEITKLIRERLAEDDSVSTPAQNVSIVTVNGVATLRGFVASEQEKDKIATVARTVEKDKKVRNELVVSPR